jgi:hypothetical protein
MNEIEAGVDRFEKFGEFNLIYNLADGDVTKFDAVFNLSYSEAFTTLYRRAEESRYQKALRKIINRAK